MASGQIKAIDRASVARICSGQVVTDLATAVKELVENALDAGARHVEVKLRESGDEQIEVSDNGAGIPPSDHEGLALKYHTSKLRTFSDLSSVSSFGFRGEALSSLCELAGKFTVITRTAGESVGHGLTYDRSGRLAKREVAPRQVGTTVIITNLFEPLPVRRAELHRGIKRQYARLLRLLQAYALVSVGVRISVVNFKGGKRQTLLATQNNASMADNVANVFGAKFLATLEPIEVEIPTDGAEAGVAAAAASSASVPSARSTSDAQKYQSRNGKGRRVQAALLDEENADPQGGSNAELGAEGEKAAAESGTSGVSRDEMTDDVDGTQEGGDIGEARAAAHRVEAAAPEASTAPPRRIFGLVSRAGAGAGRSDTERQFFYLNGRPVDLPRVARALGEVWRQFEPKQNSKPSCVLALEVGPGGFDVNLTPDKREVALVDEGAIVAALTEALETLWAPSRYTFAANQAGEGGLQTTLSSYVTSSEPKSTKTTAAAAAAAGQLAADEAAATSNGADVQGDLGTGDLEPVEPAAKKRRKVIPDDDDEGADVFGLFDKSSEFADSTSAAAENATATPVEIGSSVEGLHRPANEPLAVASSLAAFACGLEGGSSGGSSTLVARSGGSSSSSSKLPQPPALRGVSEERKAKARTGNMTAETESSFDEAAAAAAAAHGISGDGASMDLDLSEEEEKALSGAAAATANASDSSAATGEEAAVAHTPKDRSSELNLEQASDEAVLITGVIPASAAAAAAATATQNGVKQPGQMHFQTALAVERCKLAAAARARREKLLATAAPLLQGAVPSEIGAESTDDAAAARTLSRVLNKRNFREMAIVGQFNLGFIVAQLGHDLFILDQHACDEKHNFEALQKTTKMHQQPLVRPIPLEVSAAEEVTILEHLPVFERNGFRFDVDAAARPCTKLRLSAVPFSKATQFGVSDVHELAAILAEERANAASVRLPKARAMFASRACRMSIMIGTALDNAQMRRLVAQMADVEQPWNCPHGRPTMRHLVELSARRALDK